MRIGHTTYEPSYIMSNLTDTINKIKKKNVYIRVDFPILSEIITKHSIFVRRFGIDPEYLVFDPAIWTILASQKDILHYITIENNITKMLGMRLVLIKDSDILILPYYDKLQRLLDRE
jgi:hypothetical protein